ncbi:MAG: dethiobiotin synthase [Methylococcaceae bacterium]|nr:dethiobiotin synthase [Methylococcaceae bacterium]
MIKGYFITGTDTDVGKTWVTLSLLHHFKNQGKTVVGMKPVASGCLIHNGRLVNDDALQIQAHASVAADYDLINPYAYAEPVSPHIAGRHNPVVLDKVSACFATLKEQAEIILVEGAGGWYSPISQDQDMADLAKRLALPIIVVVAIRLGCINHAKLTFQALQQSGVTCAGWVATYSEPDVAYCETILQTIKLACDAPLLGVLPYMETPDFDFFAQQLSL